MPLNGDIRLVYLAPGDVLKGRVEPTIWIRMCQAFAEAGIVTELVTLYTYRRENIQRSEIFPHYGINDPKFRLTILPTPLTVKSHVLWYRIIVVGMNWFHAIKILLNAAFDRRGATFVFYSRSPAAIYPYLKLRWFFSKFCQVRFFFETHVLPTAALPIAVLRETDGIVVSSKKLANDIQELLSDQKSRVITAYLASNAPRIDVDKTEARRRLGLSPDLEYIVYTGKLLFDEVVEMLIVAEHLSTIRPSSMFVFVGGNRQILKLCKAEVWRRNLKNVSFVGFVSPAEVGYYQTAADVLVLNLLKNKDIIEYITPSKVFDPLQAARPIVIADYPILHELLEHEKNALFVPPHAPKEFAAAINRVLDNPTLAESLSKEAERSSRQYSWPQRVARIINFIRTTNSSKDQISRNVQVRDTSNDR